MADDPSDSDQSPTLTIEIPLDGPHAQQVQQLRDAGYNVEDHVTAHVLETADIAIERLFRESKYQHERHE